jgi:hypothetical protein
MTATAGEKSKSLFFIDETALFLRGEIGLYYSNSGGDCQGTPRFFAASFPVRSVKSGAAGKIFLFKTLKIEKAGGGGIDKSGIVY